MGCIPNKSKGKDLSSHRISRVDEIKVDPGTFVVSNEKSFQEVYTIGKILSSNTKGEMRKVVHRGTKEERAVRIFRKDLGGISNHDKLKQEIEILKKIDHPNIIKVFEFFEEQKRMFIVIERCRGGELFEEILKRQHFSEQQACKIVKQLLSAVAYMHEKHIVHRDLKPENILLEEKADFMNIKLIDFAAAVLVEPDSSLTGTSGTAYYIAPEVLTGFYDEKCDLWSCGVMIFILLSGYPPFDGNSDKEITEKVKLGHFNFDESIWQCVSESAKDLISKLLCPATERLSAAQALAHTWISSFSQPTVATAETIQAALQNLRNFHNTSKLRDAVHTFITTQCISTADIKDLKEVFRTIDINGDGKLSKEELLKHYEIYMGSDHAQEEVNKIMAQVDTDNNGYIDYTEFLKASLSQRTIMSSENLRRAFDLFDKDGSGSISADELKKVLGRGLSSDDKVWEQIIKSVDQNFDSEIDLREFEEIILSNV